MKKKSSGTESSGEKPYWEMTSAELAKATRRFDAPIPFSQTRPLSKRSREREARARREPAVSVREISQPAGVGRVANGTALGQPHHVTVRLDDELLAKAVEYATRHNTSLPEMLDRGLRGLLAFAG
jgi:hypothetical protein